MCDEAFEMTWEVCQFCYVRGLGGMRKRVPHGGVGQRFLFALTFYRPHADIIYR